MQTTSIWVYGGQRQASNGQLRHLWLTQGGEELLYKKAGKGCTPGFKYSVGVELKPGGDRSVDLSTIQWTGDQADNAGELQALDREAKVQQEQQRAHDKLRKEGKEFGDLTLAELRALSRSRLPHQRAGLVAAVVQYLG